MIIYILMPVPARLAPFKAILDKTLADGRAKHGKNKEGKWKFTLKAAMKAASKIYRKSKGKTSKKRGGSAPVDSPLKLGGAEHEEKPEGAPMAGGNDEGEEEKLYGGAEEEEEKPVSMGGKKRGSKKTKA